MTEATDRFAELTRQGHQVFTAAVQAWEQAARSMTEAARRPGSRLPDVGASVDAAFDFAAQMLADQRDFARTLMSAGTEAFAATAQPSGADGAETAAGPAVQPAQDADQPGADAVAAVAPATSAPTASAPTGPAATGPAATVDAGGPSGTTPAKKATAAKKTTTTKTTSTKTAKKTTPAKEAAAAKKTTTTKAPAKRAARRSGNAS